MNDEIWLAADFHVPLTYSIRAPNTNEASAPALPAPGPATVRQALVRVGVARYGINQTRDELFPIIRSMAVRAKPPEEVAVSSQRIKLYKTTSKITESIGYREFCCAKGSITVFIKIPETCETIFRELLAEIGYWGQASSLAFCTQITRRTPRPGECIEPLAALSDRLTGPFVTFVVTEFRDSEVTWSEIQPVVGQDNVTCIVPQLYVWPLIEIDRRGEHIRYQHRSLVDNIDAA